jgi:hypothetical protein
MDGLKPALLDKNFTMENIPTTLDGMVKAAAKYEGNWKRAKAIAGKYGKLTKRKPPLPRKPQDRCWR